eukprot:365938-Chlamydomonas_euryale.AAC.7
MDGLLVREDKLSREDIKLIFSDLMDIERKEARQKRKHKPLQRVARKAFGMSKKLVEKKGQLLYKGMPG